MPTQETSKRRPGEHLVVTEGGVRRDGQVFTDEASAETEAAKRRRRLQEQSGGAAPPKVEVKQQLLS